MIQHIRLPLAGLAATSVAVTLVACGGSQANSPSKTPPPQKPGWTAALIETTLTALERESKTPPITYTQAKCATAFIAEKYTPGELGVLSSTASKQLGQEAKAACGVSG